MGFSWVFGGNEPLGAFVSHSGSLGTQHQTHYHFLVLAHPNALSLDDLQIFQAAQDIMLHLEVGLHAKLSTLLDREGF